MIFFKVCVCVVFFIGVINEFAPTVCAHTQTHACVKKEYTEYDALKICAGAMCAFRHFFKYMIFSLSVYVCMCWSMCVDLKNFSYRKFFSFLSQFFFCFVLFCFVSLSDYLIKSSCINFSFNVIVIIII